MRKNRNSDSAKIRDTVKDIKALFFFPIRGKRYEKNPVYKRVIYNNFEKYKGKIEELIKVKGKRKGKEIINELFSLMMDNREELVSFKIGEIHGCSTKSELEELMDFHKFLLNKLLLSIQLISKLRIGEDFVYGFMENKERGVFYSLLSSIKLVKKMDETSSFNSPMWEESGFDREFYLLYLKDRINFHISELDYIDLKSKCIFPLRKNEKTFFIPFSRIQRIGNFTFYDASSPFFELKSNKLFRVHISSLPPLHAFSSGSDAVITYYAPSQINMRKDIDERRFRIFYLHEAMHLIQNSFKELSGKDEKFNEELIPYAFILRDMRRKEALSFVENKLRKVSSLIFYHDFSLLKEVGALSELELLLKKQDRHSSLFDVLWKREFGFDFYLLKDIELID